MFKKLLFATVLISGFACKKKQNTPQFIIENIKRNNGSEKSLTIGNDVYITGYSQITNNNQDAYAIKQTSGQTVWAKYYDKSPDDSRGEALAIERNNLVISFSCTGGNTDFKATAGSFQNSYGTGGGPKIVFLARLNAQNGAIEAATFIGSRLNDNKTNTLRPEEGNPNPITLSGEKITFRATKAYDKGDGRLTPTIGNDVDCSLSPGKWIGTFNSNMELLQGDCLVP